MDEPASEDVYTSLPAETAIYSAYNNSLYLLTHYGWHIVLVVILAVALWAWFGSSLSSWWQKRQEKQEELNFDPVKAEQYQDSLLRARERMQETQDRLASEHSVKDDENEGRKRDERIKQWEEFKVVTRSRSSDKRGGGHFPMDGSSGRDGGGGYRPARRNVGQGR